MKGLRNFLSSFLLPLWSIGLISQFLDHSQTAGLLGRVISSSQGKTQENAYTHQTSMPWVRFEPTIPAYERAKTVHALNRSATVTGGLKNKSKAIPGTGREGPSGCERSRLSHLLNNRLTDGGKVVSITRRPRFTPPGMFLVLISIKAESTPGP
jgi:hypothetical protein